MLSKSSLLKSAAAEDSGESSDREASISRELSNRDNGNRINCILTVDSNTILMGSHTGAIFVYDGDRNQKNKLPALPSPVLSMLHFQ